MIRHRASIVLFVLLCGVGSLNSILQVRGWSNELSLVDPYSEANVLREVRNFLEHGLTVHYGLGTVYYPGMYPTDGFAADPDVSLFGVSAEGVYTHYPPGPEYILYAATKLLGSEPVSRLRLVPVLLGLAAMVFFGLAVRRRFGAAIGWLVMTACMITPTVTDEFVSLHSQGYAFALLLLEIGLAIGVNAWAAPFVLIGFLQGWLSFDYVFLVTLTPLAIELVMPALLPEYQRRWKLTLRRVILAGGGFAIAHALHFMQIWAYWGSFAEAVRDLAGAAAHRAGAGMFHGPVDYLSQALSNLKLYYYGLHPFNPYLTLPASENYLDWASFRFLGLSLGPWWLLVTVGLIAWEKLKPGPAAGSLRLNWHIVSLSGMVTTSLWFVVMVNHGGAHRHFLYRHLFLMFFVMVLFAASTARRLAVEADIFARWFQRDEAAPMSGSKTPT